MDPIDEFKRIKLAFDENLEDIGADLLQAYKGALGREGVLTAVSAAEKKLEEYAACLPQLDTFFRNKFERAEQESIDQLKDRVEAIKGNPTKYGID